jgi:phosphatidylinositol-3-phosphatase
MLRTRRTPVSFAAVLVAGILAAALPSTAWANLLGNGSFDGGAGLDGWRGINGELTLASDGVGGSSAARAEVRRSSRIYGLRTAPNPVAHTTAAGSVYVGRGQLRSDSPGATVCLRLVEVAEGGLELQRAQACATAGARWQPFPPVSLTAATDGGSVAFRIAQLSASSGDSFEVDDLTLDVAQGAPGEPPSPTGLTATATASSVELSWTAPSGLDVDHYVVERDDAQVATVPGTQTTYSDDTVVAGRPYTYDVRAVDVDGNVSPPSNSIEVTVGGGGGGGGSGPGLDHVVVIVGENSGYSQVIQNPYFSALADQHGLASNLFAITHPSLPNYLALTGGSTFAVSDDAGPGSHPIAGESIFGQTDGRTLAESMPSNCASGDTALYSTHHNPQVYYADERALCAQNDVPYDAQRDGVPDLSAPFTLVVPNKCDDGHDICGGSGRDAAIQQFADYVRAFLGEAMQTPEWKSERTAIVVTFDEDSKNEGNHIYTVVVSNQQGHVVDDTPSTLYTLLGTIEDQLGVSRVRAAASAGSIADLFTATPASGVAAATHRN